MVDGVVDGALVLWIIVTCRPVGDGFAVAQPIGTVESMARLGR